MKDFIGFCKLRQQYVNSFHSKLLPRFTEICTIWATRSGQCGLMACVIAYRNTLSEFAFHSKHVFIFFSCEMEDYRYYYHLSRVKIYLLEP